MCIGLAAVRVCVIGIIGACIGAGCIIRVGRIIQVGLVPAVRSVRACVVARVIPIVAALVRERTGGEHIKARLTHSLDTSILLALAHLLLLLAAAALFLVALSLLGVFALAAAALLALHLLELLHGRVGFHSRLELTLVHYLVLDKELGNEVELIHLFGQDALCAIVLSLDYAVDLGVDLSRRLLGIVAPGGEISAEEHLVVRVLAAENDRSELGVAR